MPGLTKEEIQSYYDERNLHAKNPVRIETVGEMSARLYLTAEQRHLRSGDTISIRTNTDVVGGCSHVHGHFRHTLDQFIKR